MEVKIGENNILECYTVPLLKSIKDYIVKHHNDSNFEEKFIFLINDKINHLNNLIKENNEEITNIIFYN